LPFSSFDLGKEIERFQHQYNTMKSLNSISKRMTNNSLCLIAGAAIFFSACKQDQSVQSPSGGNLPLNTETYDGISNASIGVATLSFDVNGHLDVTGMASTSDGVSTDVSSKTSWDEIYNINWPETGSDNLLFNAVHSGGGGSSTTSSLSVRSADTNTLWITPVFTGGTDTQYTLSVYNGALLVATETALGPSNNSIEIRQSPYTLTHHKSSFTPASLVMTGTGNQTTFGINPGPSTCSWQMMSGAGVDSVTTPLGLTYGATMIQLTETITNGTSSFDHIQQVGNVGTMVIDTVVVN
jgi:hypothetical protein